MNITLTESKIENLLILFPSENKDYSEVNKLLSKFNNLPEKEREELWLIHDMIKKVKEKMPEK